MKLLYKFVFSLTVTFISFTVNAQDSLYIYKDGVVIDKHELAEIDSVIFYKAEVPKENTVTDIDGNVYNTVVIGTQTWMVENLKTTTYNDGSSILNETDNSLWAGLTNGAYCWYGNDEGSYKELYGALYNWYAVETGKLCPEGWHVPTDSDWSVLIEYITSRGYDGQEGGVLKAISGWAEDGNGTDNYGFSGLPAGFRYSSPGMFLDIEADSHWWSSTAYDSQNGYFRSVLYNDTNIYRYYYLKSGGYSVRCIKD